MEYLVAVGSIPFDEPFGWLHIPADSAHSVSTITDRSAAAQPSPLGAPHIVAYDVRSIISR